jgi:RND family efflux transporter MFP subunit
LVELDSTPLKERLDSQFLSLQRAESEKIQAEASYNNRVIQNEIDLAEAQLDLELATMELENYDNADEGGTYQIDLQNVEMEIQKSRADQLIKNDNLTTVEMLYRLGYKSQGALAESKLDRLQSQSELVSRLSDLRQLTDYTHEMTKLELTAAVETAQAELDQVKVTNEAELAQAEAERKSAKNEWEKEKERYERYESQLAKCKIHAPQDGMVAYAAPDRRGRGTVIAEGAFVRQRQKILTLPNLSKMQVSTTVHESVLDQVKAGLPAVIRVDAFGDRAYKGTVESVGVLPEPGAWYSSDTKVYKTIVTIDEEVEQLKPGMTAVVQISVANLENVLSVPIQAIVQRESDNWCYVSVDGTPRRRGLRLGRSNAKFVEVLEGLDVGDEVVLNPQSILEQEGELPGKSNTEKPAAKEKQAGAKQGEAKQPSVKTRGGGAKKAAGKNAAAAAQQKAQRWFASMDKDGDGKLSKEEVPGPLQARFDQMDRNQDGKLEASELRAMMGGRPGGGMRKQRGSPQKGGAESVRDNP